VKLRQWIVRALWTGGAALGIGILSGVLALVLSAVGDQTGAEAVRGVLLVALSVFGLALVSLVVILAINELLRKE
jgi:hypothetical protein